MKLFFTTLLSIFIFVGSLSAQQELKICSFNIMWVGNYKKKDNEALASFLNDRNYDIVLVQELVSAPRDGVYPDGTTYTADKEAKAFLDAMINEGYDFELSLEDTGTADEIHKTGSSTEWYIVFYKPSKVKIDEDLITGFLADDRSNHPSYERVPHAFSFETRDGNLDFTLISVHLKPASGPTNRARRAEELDAIEAWINSNNASEKDFIIAGDMNIENKSELVAALPNGYLSLNQECGHTTTATSKVSPYDHVMFSTRHTGNQLKDFKIIDLKEAMRPYWNKAEAYPENDNNLFRQYFSDHYPIEFVLVSEGNDED